MQKSSVERRERFEKMMAFEDTRKREKIAQKEKILANIREKKARKSAEIAEYKKFLADRGETYSAEKLAKKFKKLKKNGQKRRRETKV
jgi:23S rRNA pseudoU1915 N3-methylase RlmH